MGPEPFTGDDPGDDTVLVECEAHGVYLWRIDRPESMICPQCPEDLDAETASPLL